MFYTYGMIALQLRMGMDEVTLDERIKTICKDLGTPDPLHFLAQVMSGTDPRNASPAYLLAQTLIGKYGDEAPPLDEYQQLLETILSLGERLPVSLDHSHAAAKQIIEYIHPKKKQVAQETTHILNSKPTELTAKEVRKFKREFKRDYGGRR